MSDVNEGFDAQDVSQGVENSVPESQPEGQGSRGATPWAKDLEALGLGDRQADVDRYLAEKWQPHVTQLEQRLAGYDVFQDPADVEAAAQLLYMYRENPHEAHKAVTELIQQMVESGQIDPLTDVPDPVTPDPEPEQPAAIPSEYQSLLDQIKQEREEAENERRFEELMNTYQKDVPGLEPEWFAKLIVANGGDVEAAITDFKAIFPDKSTPVQEPPPTMGDAGTSPPISEQRAESLAEAVSRVVDQHFS